MATIPSTALPGRIVTLDVIRGIAVMGIFAVNVIGMSMIDAAYLNPTAPRGWDIADVSLWLVNYVLIDGKMRSLFSMLFGASMLLVIERAEAADEPGWSVHFRRMGVLALFGLLHYYVIWFGDILFVYAMTGMAAFFFRNAPARFLVFVAAVLFAWNAAGNIAAASGLHATAIAAHSAGATKEERDEWVEATNGWATETDSFAREQVKHYHAPFVERVADINLPGPYYALRRTLPETLALMLVGMVLFRTGFLGGEWGNRSYWRVAGWGIAIGGAACLAFGIIEWASGFYAPLILLLFLGLGAPFQLLMAIGYAALIILLSRPGGAMVTRFAAVGRAAFTNYLGCSILGTAIFYGLKLYGTLDRVQVTLYVPLFWALMLLWSKPWLDRFAYGPFEWAWRSLARGKLQPMRKLPFPGQGGGDSQIRPKFWLLTLRPKPPGERVSRGLVALSNSSAVRLNRRRSSTTSGTSSSGKRRVSTHRRAVLSISSATFASGSAPNWRASPLMVCAGRTSAAVFSSCIASSIWATDFAPSSRK